jgi:hypothetical protein
MQPLDIERWIVIGFAAFLAGLAGQWAGINFTPRWQFGFPPDWDHLVQAPFHNLLQMLRGSTWFLFGIPFALAALVVGLALLWLSSRGKLIFLDNMVRGRSAFVEPWKRCGQLGDSLFIWRLGFYLAALLLAGAVLSPMVWLGRNITDSTIGRPFAVLATFSAMFGALIFGVVVAYVTLFLESFIVPLMYRRQISAIEAWKQFLPLLRSHLPEFVAYGLVVLLGWMAVFLCLIPIALITCCILPMLLSVPYLRSVLLLPLTGFYRLYSVEFLEQFGPEFAMPTVAPPPAPETGPSAP